MYRIVAPHPVSDRTFTSRGKARRMALLLGISRRHVRRIAPKGA